MGEIKPEIKITDMGDKLKLNIINAGHAGRIFQYHIDWKDSKNPTITFLRIVPPNQFVGTYNNKYIAKGLGNAKRKGLNSFITCELIVDKSEFDSVMKQIKTYFKEIHTMVQSGKLRDPNGQGKVIRVKVL